MSRFAIVLGCNLHWAPYYYRYEKILNDYKIPFDVIIWNREGIKEVIDAPCIEFQLADVSCNNNPSKVFKFFRFARFVKRIVKRNQYSKIIFLGFQGCALTLNARYFSSHYKNRYWIDIRDYHYEWFKPYYRLEQKVINSAYDVAISSDGFKEFLPEYDYLHMHNVDPNMESVVRNFEHIEDTKQIRISFIGNVRYFNENCALLKCLGNDKRFKIQFYGTGTDKLKEFCEVQQIRNVDFHGRFEQSETVGFYNQTDIINNIYGNNSKEVTTALSNKLYYAIYLHMPILVSSGTYMERFCESYGFSYTFKEERDFGDSLFNWYMSNVHNDKKAYIAAQQLIEKEEEETFNKLKDFLIQ